MTNAGTVVVDVVDEAIEETIGASSKKWALVLVAFVAGAALAVWLVGRLRVRGQPGTGGAEGDRDE